MGGVRTGWGSRRRVEAVVETRDEDEAKAKGDEGCGQGYAPGAGIMVADCPHTETALSI
jgi:hypothetical protein